MDRREFLKTSAVVGGGVTASGAFEWLRSGQALAASSTGCRLGVMASPRNGQTWKTAITHLEHEIGRRFAIIRKYHTWEASIPTQFETWNTHNGRTPYTSWHAIKANGTPLRWASIASGGEDGRIRSQAISIKKWGQPLYLSFHHEPEDDTGICGSAADFVAAWGRVRHIFDAVGVTNVTWIATLMASTYAGNNGGADSWLPSSYDLLGVDGYNRWPCISGQGWRTFAEIFAPAHKVAVRRGHGLFIGEFGTVEQNACGHSSGNPRAKANWFQDSAATIKTWPQVKAACYSHTEAGNFRYWVDTTDSSLAAFRAVSLKPYFRG